MIVPAETIALGAHLGADSLEPGGKSLPAGPVGGTQVLDQMRAIDGLDAERPGLGEDAVEIGLQRVDGEMARRHGEAMGIHDGAEAGRVLIDAAEAFHLCAAGFGEHRQDIRPWLKIASAVELKREIHRF